jgi:hypothetical protein
MAGRLVPLCGVVTHHTTTILLKRIHDPQTVAGQIYRVAHRIFTFLEDHRNISIHWSNAFPQHGESGFLPKAVRVSERFNRRTQTHQKYSYHTD